MDAPTAAASTAIPNGQPAESEEATEYPVPGYLLDLKALFAQWKNSPAKSSFQEFKNIWKELQMSFLFAAQPDTIPNEDWFQALVEATWGYFYVNHVKVRVGVLYALYLLYNCQPYRPSKKIKISVIIYTHFRRFISTLKETFEQIPQEGVQQDTSVEPELKDVLAMFYKLYEQKAFCFTAQARIVPPPTVVKFVQTKSTALPSTREIASSAKVVDTEGLQRFQSVYENAKRQAGQSHLNSATGQFLVDLKKRMDQTLAAAKQHHPSQPQNTSASMPAHKTPAIAAFGVDDEGTEAFPIHVAPPTPNGVPADSHMPVVDQMQVDGGMDFFESLVGGPDLTSSPNGNPAPDVDMDTEDIILDDDEPKDT